MSIAEEKIEKKAPSKKVATKKVSTKEVAVKKAPAKKKWFVIHARSGYEAKVKVAIEEAVSREGIEDLVGEIMIPTEQVVELKGGKKKETERKFFPGYMLIKMELTEPSWLLVKNTNNVIGFIGGSSGKPSPITQREVDRIFARVQEGVDKPKPKVAFQPGEEVLVISGPFNEFNGSVESVNYAKSLLTVEVLIFGRTTAVELEFTQVEKT
jgi:transcriptional antiterminator NusG